MQQTLARPFWDSVVSELEEVFDRAAGPDQLLRLDRLELDLGTLGGGNWPLEFRKKLIAELTRSFAQVTPVSETDDKGGRGEPRRAEPWRQFLFFLAHGRLPWWATAPLRQWNDVLSTGSDADWNALRETISSDPSARSRLVYSVDDECLDRAIGRWSAVPGAARVMEQLTPSHLRADPRRGWRRGFWVVVLDWVATRSPHDGPQLLRDLRMLRAMYESPSARSSTVTQPASEGSGHDGRSRPSASDLPEPWRGWWLSPHDASPSERAATESPAAAGNAQDRAPSVSTPRSRASETTRRAVEDEAIYLSGAGVILVHPFLEQLFRERGLLAGRNFRGLEARDRAVHLIGFLTFGRVEVPEHELVLAKVLCGAALEDPIEPVPLEDDDIAACDALLRAVLGHWTALRSSSPQWLREQFFLREGKLEEVDFGRRLTIERRAQDVLLARLPWGFGVVALPWLTAQMFVHWLD